MRESLIKLLNSYLMLFPEEAERQKLLIEYLDSHNDNELVDWNNFDGISWPVDLFMQKKKISF